MASLSAVGKWDIEVDVAIAGIGLAGCVAAVEALESRPGTQVAVFEKASEARAGGNSRVSGQALWIARPDQLDAVLSYQRRLNATHPIPEPLLERWARDLVQLEPWIKAKAEAVSGADAEDMGLRPLATIAEFPELGAEAAVAYNATIRPNPSGVWRTFREHVSRRPEISLHHESPVVDLVQDPDSGEVFGCIVEKASGRLAVRARGGVILACGSFEAAEHMHKNFWGAERMITVGSPSNTGDGIVMLQKAGARLWHMRNFVQSAGNWPAIEVPEFDAGFLRELSMPGGAWMDIGADHQRFYDEAFPFHLQHYHRIEHGHWTDLPLWRALPVHMIFDDALRVKGPIVTSLMSWNTVAEGYRWSADNSTEIDRGWIIRADSLAQLARRIGRPQDALAAAMNAFDRAATGREPCAFGRRAASMTAFAGPPYYAVELVPGIVCSTGGGERDEHCQVINHAGEPIAGLYEAGELGTIFSGLYQNGAFLTEAMISGRIAGRQAAARGGAR